MVTKLNLNERKEGQTTDLYNKANHIWLVLQKIQLIHMGKTVYKYLRKTTLHIL